MLRRRLGPLLVAFIACVWLNQSVGLIAWEKLRYLVFTDPAAHLVDAARYPFIFLYRRSTDEAMYYGTAAQILGEPYDHEVFELHSRGRVTGVAAYETPPPPTDGHWHAPWREVHLEYPPPVLPFVLAPKLVADGFEPYAKLFGVSMGLCMVLSIALAIDVVRRANAARTPRPNGLDARWWLAAGLLLAQGALTIQRLDPLVALTMIAMVHGAVRRKPVETGLWAGLAGACKIVPLLVVPAIVIADWSFWRTRLVTLGTWMAAGLALGFGPMFLASPTAIVDLFRYHGIRGLQVESTLGAVVGAVRIALGTTRPATISYGSFNIDGAVPDALARLALPLTLAGIAALCVFCWREWRHDRGRADENAEDEPARIGRITCAALAATVVLWLTGKVFSPQYLTWGIPLVLAIPGRRGVIACWIAVAALTVTQLYYRGFYDLVFDQEPVGVAAVLARQAILVALLAFVMRQPAFGVSADLSPSAKEA
jgi:Glycosyltransferase family 87